MPKAYEPGKTEQNWYQFWLDKGYFRAEVDPDKEPFQLTIMIKDREHPSARGGWIWLVKDTRTGEEKIIDIEFCITCHANANEPHPYGDMNKNAEFRDYVFFPGRFEE